MLALRCTVTVCWGVLKPGKPEAAGASSRLRWLGLVRGPLAVAPGLAEGLAALAACCACEAKRGLDAPDEAEVQLLGVVDGRLGAPAGRRGAMKVHPSPRGLEGVAGLASGRWCCVGSMSVSA